MSIREQLTIDIEGLDRHTVQAIRDSAARIIAEARGDAEAPGAVRGWTPRLAAMLDGRLRVRGRSVQADVIAAIARAGGFVDRDSVYRIGGYDPERSLNGFTKPVSGVMRELVDEGLLPENAASPLSSEYDPTNAAFQRARGFSMPADVAELFATAVG